MNRTGRLKAIVHDGVRTRSVESGQLLHGEGLLTHTHSDSDLLLNTHVGDKQVLLDGGSGGNFGLLLEGGLVH